MEWIDSLDDPRLDTYRQIKIINRQRQQACFVVEGRLLVERLLASRYPTESVLCIRRLAEEMSAVVPTHVPLWVIPDAWISELVGFQFHRGVLACGRRLPLTSLAELSAAADTATYVVCPHVQDPENLGSILRVSAAFGVNGVLAGEACPDHLSRRVLRVSMGAGLVLPIRRSATLIEDLSFLRDHEDVELVATVLADRAENLERFQRRAKLALLLGREDQGLDEKWLDLCQRQVTIPMQLQTDSLNVAVAAGIFLYHLHGGRFQHPPSNSP